MYILYIFLLFLNKEWLQNISINQHFKELKYHIILFTMNKLYQQFLKNNDYLLYFLIF